MPTTPPMAHTASADDYTNAVDDYKSNTELKRSFIARDNPEMMSSVKGEGRRYLRLSVCLSLCIFVEINCSN